MNDLLSHVVLIVCVASAILAHLYALQSLRVADRIPLLVFTGSYLITSVIGATVIGVNGIGYLETIRGGLATHHIREIGSVNYWLLVYLPLIIPPLIVGIMRQTKKTSSPTTPLLANDLCLPRVYMIIFAGATAFCVYCMHRGGFGISLGSWSRLAGEFKELMILRQDIRESVGSLFFRMIYGGLPALSFAALYQLWRHRTVTWAILFPATFVVVCWLGLAVILKSVTLVYFAAIAVALLELRVAKYRSLAYLAIACFTALTIMQFYFMGEWSMGRSLGLVTNRMAVSFPYYLNVYPHVLPYQGLDLGLWVVGVGQQPMDNIEVFNIMYPSVSYATGNAAAPAHLALYSQYGMAGAIGAMVVVGLGIGAVIRFRSYLNGPISFAIYIQALVTIYYATQVSLVDLVLSSYGLPWCGLTLIPMWFAAQLGSRRVAAKAEHSRLELAR